MGQVTLQTKWYTYSQNNSGGSFKTDSERGIGHYVLIEAISAADADTRAEAIGLYFNGLGDCSCCGNRWSRHDESWMEATDDPRIYDKPAPRAGRGESAATDRWKIPSFAHPIAGEFYEVAVPQ